MTFSAEDKIKQAADLYLSGLSTRDIAPIIGVSKSTAALYVKKAGVETNAAERISKKMQGKTSPRKGARHTAEAKQKMSAAHSGHNRNLGSKRTPEQCALMSEKAALRWAPHNEAKAVQRAIDAEARKSARLLPEAERIARTKARDACKRMLRRILTMSRARKDRKTEQILGYTKDELRIHLESQFREGMSWGERESFHIDHIIPVAAFFRMGIYDPAVINALSNLQVLTPAENRAKSDKFTAQGPVAGVRDA